MSEAVVKHRKEKRVFNVKIGDERNGWTVIYGPHYEAKNRMKWLCRCKCGTQRWMPTWRFVDGDFVGCGCETGPSAMDFDGKRFHNFVVIAKTTEMRKRGRMLECLCDCGKYFICRSSDVVESKVHSCGCYASPRRKAHALPIRERFFKPHLKSYTHNAKARNLEWRLSNIEFQELVLMDCFYCGAKPSMRPRWNTSAFDTVGLLLNGVDRVNSKLGYSKENCVACCPQCNTAKLDYSFAEFKDWIKRVATHLNLISSPQPESYAPATIPQSLLEPAILQ